MRLTFLGHASLLVESSGVSILSDPWWSGPCFGAQWWVYPPPALSVLEERPPRYLYISHGHNDHLHPGTLSKFSREVRILAGRGLDIAPALRGMGFSVLELPDGAPVDLGSGVMATIRTTVGGDSFLVISDGRETCVNLNDALHATPPDVQDRFMAWLRQRYPRLDYVFCGYGTASHFPNCYRIPGKDDGRTAARRQHHFNTAWARIIQGLQPAFAFPFAADVVLLERDLFWANEPLHNAERPLDLLARGGGPGETQAMDIAPGFRMEDGAVVAPCFRQPVSNDVLVRQYAAQIERANHYAEVSPGQVREALSMLEGNLRICEDYFRTFPGEYRVLLRFRNSAEAIEVAKSRRALTVHALPEPSRPAAHYDLIFTTRLSYLKRSLDSAYGNEILFVGSGCLFEYSDASLVARRIHEEVRHIVSRHQACPPPRHGGSSPFVFRSKQLVKRALGMTTSDLYDLQEWSVFTRDRP